MKTKEWLRLLTSAVVLALLIASCGGQETTEPAGETGGEETPAAAVSVTITVWDFGGAEYSWLDDIAIPAFEEQFPNIKIEHIGVPEEELGLKLETAIAAGEPPDLSVFPPPRLFAAGHVLPLDEYMARDGLSRDDYGPIFHSDNLFAGGNTYAGKTYGLPADTNAWGMVYNKDLFAEAGLPELKATDYTSFDEWLEYARAINKPAETLDERVWGSAMFTPMFNSMNNYMSDPYVLGDDGRTCQGNANTEAWVQTWEVLKTAYLEDLTTESAGAMLADVQEDMFIQGKIGMQPAALGDALYAREQGLNVGFVGQPRVTEGWPGNVGGWNTSYYIMSASEHPEEAWKFLKWLSTEAPKIVPIGTDALEAAGGGLPGIPAYLPLRKEGFFAEQLENDPLVVDAVELTSHFQTPPFSPDIWATTDPFYTAFTQMTEEDVPVDVALNDATEACQEILDELWAGFDSLGK